MRRLIPFSLLLLLSVNAFAQGAVEYRTLKEVMAAGFYRLTCSDVRDPIQAHTYLEVENDRVTALKIIYVTPAKSLNVIEYAKADLAKIVVTETDRLQIAGDRPGAYWDESYLLNLREARDGSLTAEFEYDDGDGLALHRTMKCGALNYILSPRR